MTVRDCVSVSRWRVQRNIIADFAKDGGNFTSYGAFFKGAGEENIFEQNLVRCELRHSGQRRIGFSFGSGRPGRRFCRDGRFNAEPRRGTAMPAERHVGTEWVRRCGYRWLRFRSKKNTS